MDRRRQETHSAPPGFGIKAKPFRPMASSNQTGVYLDGKQNFDKVKADLIKQYGEPTVANPRIWLWKWKWKDSKIEVMLSYQERFARTTVGFQNKGI